MHKKEKILICGILPPPLFGHSAMYKILMESSFIDAFDITFLDMKFWTYAQDRKVTVVKLFKMIKYFIKFKWLIITKRPRYVLYNMSFEKMPFLKDFLFCYIGKLFGCRIVIHDMGQYVKELYDVSGKIYQALIRCLLRNTTACIMLGEGTKEVYRGLIDQKRLFAVPGSVEDSHSIHLEDGRERDSKKEINVLFFSYMTESKGVLTAFHSASRVLDGHNDIRFTFAGPMGSAAIQQAFDQLRSQYNSRITYLGYIGDLSERTRIYRNADIFIFPTHRDVFGLVLLHAMAEGLPVIASIEGTIPEIIKDGENGFLIRKGDDEQLAQRVLRLANDPQLRSTMGEANRQRYLKVYSPREYGRKMIEVFEGIDKLS
jgi:glycosyltransferase involved in cell wall biosynthesis